MSAAFTLAEAREALKAKKISSRELDEALVKAVADARTLNAYVTETPEKALAMAAASDARLAKGEGGALEGLAAGDQGPVLHQGGEDHGGKQNPGQFRAAL